MSVVSRSIVALSRSADARSAGNAANAVACCNCRAKVE